MFGSTKEFEAQTQNGLLYNGIQFKKRSQTRKSLPQIIATVAFGMLIFGVAAICVMPTIVIGALYKKQHGGNQTEESEIPMTVQEASWFGSVVYIAQPLGSLTSGFIQELFGRRKCMMGVTIPQFLGWVILYFSNSVEHLFISAVIMGLSVGFMEAPAMSYLGEVCEPRLRGTLSSFSQTFLLTGILFKFFMGASLYWRHSCAAAALIPVTAFIIIYMIPESPTWYVVKGRHADAEKALRWLRGWVTKEEVQQELLALSVSIHQEYQTVPTSEKNNSNKQCTKPKRISEWEQMKLLGEPRIYRPILLLAVFFFVAHCTSLIGLRPFLVKIFGDLHMPMSPYTVLVLSGLLQTLGSIVCAISIHKLGKRILAFITMTGCTLSCFLLSIYIFSQLDIPWIPIFLFGLNFFCGGFGVMTLPWILVSEIFPLDARGISAGLTAATAYTFAFIITKSYIDLESIVQLPGVLLIYSIIGVFGIIFLYFRLPETEDKTLAEIEVYFKK